MGRESTHGTVSKMHIQPSKDRVMVKKADLQDSTTQKPLRMRNKALLSLDGGGLRGILTGKEPRAGQA